MLPVHSVRLVPIYIGDQCETEFKNTVVYGYLVALHIHIWYCAEVLRHFLFCFGFFLLLFVFMFLKWSWTMVLWEFWRSLSSLEPIGCFCAHFSAFLTLYFSIFRKMVVFVKPIIRNAPNSSSKCYKIVLVPTRWFPKSN